MPVDEKPPAMPGDIYYVVRVREISSDFAKMNSSAYVGTLEFIFAKSAKASHRLAFNYQMLNNILHVPDNLSNSED